MMKVKVQVQGQNDGGQGLRSMFKVKKGGGQGSMSLLMVKA